MHAGYPRELPKETASVRVLDWGYAPLLDDYMEVQYRESTAFVYPHDHLSIIRVLVLTNNGRSRSFLTIAVLGNDNMEG